MKYVEFGESVSGFGNQIRGLNGAILLSLITGRQLKITNYWMNKVFILNKEYLNLDKTLSKINVPCESGTNFTNSILKNGNLNNITQDIIYIGTGQDISGILSQNKNHETEYNNIINGSHYNFVKKYLVDILKTIKPELLEKTKEIINWEDEKFISLQFRSFYDAGFSNMKILDRFIERFEKMIKVNGYENMKIFITSDNERPMSIIRNKLSKYNIVESSFNGHSGHDKNINTVLDWIFLTKSEFILSTGTSYINTIAMLFDVDVYKLDFNRYDDYFNKNTYISL